MNFRVDIIVKKNINLNKSYYALEKVEDMLDTYNVVTSSESKKYLIKKGYKYIFDVLNRKIIEVKENE